MNRLSNVFQFLLGFFLGVILLAGGTASLAYVAFYRMSANPPKPTFTEEKPQEKTAQKSESDSEPVANDQKETEKVEEVSVTETEPEEVAEEEKETLPTGAYRAKVTWSTGLSLRAEPDFEAERIGGVGYNSEIIVLKTSPDGDWQQVRLSGSEQEGWVKAGNIEKVTEEEEQ
ncbi:MAG: SH3 domain-containing protein [Cyanobacteria bacterium P01_G01_bin.49]